MYGSESQPDVLYELKGANSDRDDSQQHVGLENEPVPGLLGDWFALQQARNFELKVVQGHDEHAKRARNEK